MKETQFEIMVRTLERKAIKHPRRYKWTIASFAMLGYGYLAATLLLTVSLFIIAVLNFLEGSFTLGGLKVALLTAIVGFIMARSLYVRFDTPEGISLSREAAPILHKTIQTFRNDLKTPAIHEVLLTNEFNASMTQVPRLGFFGWHKNYLEIGLPLMMSLSKEELDAIIAHEMGHLSKSHSRFGAWIYRVRTSWVTLLQRFEEEDIWISFLFRPFFQWFVPRFDAYTIVLARQEEFIADQISVKLTNSKVVGDALLRTALNAYISNDFWSRLFQNTSEDETCPRPFSKLKEAFSEADFNTQETALNKTYLTPVTFDSSHPSLKERLEAIGEHFHIPKKLDQTSELVYLESPEEFQTIFDNLFVQYEEAEWKEVVIERKNKRREIEELKQKEQNFETKKKIAFLTAEYHDQKEALPLFEDLVTTYPNAKEDPEILFCLGTGQLLNKNEAGLSVLEKVIQLDWRSGFDVFSEMATYYEETEQYDKIESLDRRASEWQDIVSEAQYERDSISKHDTFLPHDINPKTIETLIHHLRAIPQIQSAYLYKKEIGHFANFPLHILTIDMKAKRSERNQLFERLAATISCEEEILLHSMQDEPFIKKVISKSPEGNIYIKK